jgi:hypothetical protein
MLINAWYIRSLMPPLVFSLTIIQLKTAEEKDFSHKQIILGA